MAYTAVVECNGIPIDNALHKEIDENFPAAKEKIIADINSRLGVYENGSFSQKNFKSLVASEGLIDRWPKTISGQLKTTEKEIYKFAQENKAISELYFLKEFVDSRKLKGFVVGPDGRARANLNMFGLITGRTNQSTSRYPFNAAKPMRNIIKPNDNWAMISGDYKAQEIAIAAYLSKDPMLISMYKEKDIYISIATTVGAAPKGATKLSHPSIRNKYKVVLLACFYGQGAKSLAAQLDITIDEAVKIQQDIKNLFPVYFEWIEGIVNRAMIRGYISTKFGWRYWLSKTDKIKPTTLFNFPIQAHGSEMLRHALIGLTEKDIEVSALIHDGIMVHCPLNNIAASELKVKKIMEDASRIVLDGNVCPVDIVSIKTNYKQEKEEQNKFDRMMSIIRYPSNQSTGVVEPFINSAI